MFRDAANDQHRETRSTIAVAVPPERGETTELLKRYFEGQQQLRRGICLLNAGQYDPAIEAFSTAARLNPQSRPLPVLLTACYVGQGRYDLAAAQMERHSRNEPADVTGLIRRALLLWRDSRPNDAIESLRQSVAEHSDSAELQFQLGTLLASMDEYDEAELRFTQAIAIDQDHAEALVALAQCCAVDQRVGEAQRYLARAQSRRTNDARIGLLLSQAAKALSDSGAPVDIEASIPVPESAAETEGIEQLSRIVESDPEFIDAFLDLPSDQIDEDLYALLAEAISQALNRRPGDAGLHCAAGRVLTSMGRHEQAISATERAVGLDRRHVRALIQLGHLYDQSNRDADAVERLEQAVAAGAEYADVYYLLGNLHRRNGQAAQARQAYVRALKINKNYEAARTALKSLAA